MVASLPTPQPGRRIALAAPASPRLPSQPPRPAAKSNAGWVMHSQICASVQYGAPDLSHGIQCTSGAAWEQGRELGDAR